jgi:hypothetical protein
MIAQSRGHHSDIERNPVEAGQLRMISGQAQENAVIP